jgi:hypothetical protein
MCIPVQRTKSRISTCALIILFVVLVSSIEIVVQNGGMRRTMERVCVIMFAVIAGLEGLQYRKHNK